MNIEDMNEEELRKEYLKQEIWKNKTNKTIWKIRMTIGITLIALLLIAICVSCVMLSRIRI